ncbi:MAG: RNA-guided endonuclease InsQ/TnpB family protein [Gemmatimonadota bacterium]
MVRQVRYTYRLRVSATAERALRAEWDRCRWVWNQCVAESRQAWREQRACGPAGLDKMLTGWRAEHGWLREGSSVAQKQAIRDFGKSRAKALKDRKNKIPVPQRAGLPQFRKRDRSAPTMNYTKQGFSLRHGRLIVAGGISLRVVWSRALPSVPSSVRVCQDSLGHWYASFVVQAGPEPLPETGKAIGIDWGVTDIAITTSGEHDLPHPEFAKKSAAKLAKYQRQMARRKPHKGKPASAGYKRARRQAAKVHAKAAAQRQDTSRKWAKKVVRDFDQVAAEDFRPKFLAKSAMARKAADAAIGSAKSGLLEMAAKHGRIVHLVHPAHTTTDCSACGARAKQRLPLSQRTYTCSSCGTVLPRDKNSAAVMLTRAGLTPAGADRIRPHAA